MSLLFGTVQVAFLFCMNLGWRPDLGECFLAKLYRMLPEYCCNMDPQCLALDYLPCLYLVFGVKPEKFLRRNQLELCGKTGESFLESYINLHHILFID